MPKKPSKPTKTVVGVPAGEKVLGERVLGHGDLGKPTVAMPCDKE